MPAVDPAGLLASLHEHPETAHQERRTASTLRDFLSEAGLEPTAEAVAGHGMLYQLGDDRGDGPTRFWRAELDALPHGHRCGHDGHMTMLATAMARLADHDIPGRIVVLFQPAEETGEGMARCLQDPRLPDRFDEGIAIHNLPGRPLGDVHLTPGCLASTGLRLHLHGRTSHAAEPQNSLSPWPQIQRAADAAEPYKDARKGMATFIHARLGDEAYGTSPGEGVAAFTIRAEEDDQVQAIADQIRAAADGPCEVEAERVEPFPALRNDAELLRRVEDRSQQAGLHVSRADGPLLWSEDFGHAAARGPIALVGLGSGQDQAPLHDDAYRFPEEAVEPGIRFWMAQAGVGA